MTNRREIATMNKLDAIKSTKKTGKEPFHNQGDLIGFDLLSFWQWSNSELVGNALRGILAEYLVASDIGDVTELRQEWDSYDLVTKEGIKIEVKSSAYIQSWMQDKLSNISFGIQPTFGIDPKTGKRTDIKKRQADFYVFCVLANKEQDSIDPKDVSQWEFYVLPTSVLDRKVPKQKKIALSSLKRLNPTKVKYGEIYTTIKLLKIDKLR